ncbi:hypothetical protein Shyhy01_38310 [Streptomyces hygroscopicus subsp. hygroscopicus]|nr:hypothetical protein Shyhy01_38310 [Streptomyces hygroscopicus subsp. hygroscopicus]
MVGVGHVRAPHPVDSPWLNPTEVRFGIQTTQSMWCRAPRDRTDSWNTDAIPSP